MGTVTEEQRILIDNIVNPQQSQGHIEDEKHSGYFTPEIKARKLLPQEPKGVKASSLRDITTAQGLKTNNDG